MKWGRFRNYARGGPLRWSLLIAEKRKWKLYCPCGVSVIVKKEIAWIHNAGATKANCSSHAFTLTLFLLKEGISFCPANETCDRPLLNFAATIVLLPASLVHELAYSLLWILNSIAMSGKRINSILLFMTPQSYMINTELFNITLRFNSFLKQTRAADFLVVVYCE